MIENELIAWDGEHAVLRGSRWNQSTPCGAGTFASKMASLCSRICALLSWLRACCWEPAIHTNPAATQAFPSPQNRLS